MTFLGSKGQIKKKINTIALQFYLYYVFNILPCH